MKATYAFGLDYTGENRVRRLALELGRTVPIGYAATQVSPHLSLKTSRSYPDFDALERHFERFSRTLAVQTFTVSELCLWRLENTTIAYLDVLEQETLQALHQRLHLELTALLGDVHAELDGPQFHFHITVANGPLVEAEYDRLERKRKILWTSDTVNCITLQLIVAPDDQTFFCYKTFRLT